jgi:hypothetical protein
MPVLPDDRKEYFAFASELLKDLDALNFSHETVLWHYTSGSALLSIIDSGTLYSTQVSCLNDSTEVRYGARLFKDALTKLLSEYAGEQQLLAFIQETLKFFDEEPDFPVNAAIPYFVTCFSLDGDDLNQWRSYCYGENGYAIGFKASGLLGIPNSLLVRVNYDRDAHLRLAIKASNATVRFFKEGIEKKRADSIEQWTKEFLAVWDDVITQLAPMIKDPSFLSEKEFRIVHQLTTDDARSIRVMQKETMMSRHLPLRTPSIAVVPTLPIVGVRVGPCRHPAVTRISVDTALRQRGYGGGLVSSSSVPFRHT